MHKVAFIVPNEEQIDLVNKTFDEHNKHEFDSGIVKESNHNYELRYFFCYQDIIKENFHPDVIVSRGLTAHELKSSIADIPVVEIQISSYDILCALDYSRQNYPGKMIGAIASQSMINNVEKIAQIIGGKVKTYYTHVHDNEIYQTLIEKACHDGCEVILGGYSISKIARSLGLNYISIQTDRQAIWQAITEVKQAIKIMDIEQEKLLRMKAIFDYSYEGIITLDRQNVVTVINSQAERILKIRSSNIVGKKIDTVISDSQFSYSIKNNQMYVNEIMKYENIQLAVNKVPLTYRNEIVGNVITFQDITKIQEVEGKIRNKIYALGHVAKFNFSDIIGLSKKTKETISLAKRFAKVNSNILIIGETGTGKEVFAQSIHNDSSRKDGPFVAINCAALPETLLESELFGYAEGAFTGAAKGGKPGMFELAHRGTIFLDEISELPPKLQGRLLRVLQEKKIMRLGDDRVISVDVRIIAATNKELKNLVNQGEFREDLYFRLNVLKLRLAPLRQRCEDIKPLVENYIKQFALELNRDEVSLDNNAMSIMETHQWPGNIRELKNTCERLIVTAESNEISFKDVESILLDESELNTISQVSYSKSKKPMFEEIIETSSNLKDKVLNLEKQQICEMLTMYNNNKAKVAKHLGISRTTLWRRMKEWGLE